MIEPIRPIKGGQGHTDEEIEGSCLVWLPLLALFWLLVLVVALKSCGG